MYSMSKKLNLKQETYPMQKSQLPRCPWDKITIDTRGPYPTSYHGNKYLITVIDFFTSYPDVYPLPDISAGTIAKV